MRVSGSNRPTATRASSAPVMVTSGAGRNGAQVKRGDEVAAQGRREVTQLL